MKRNIRKTLLPLALLAGWAASVMARPLDTSKKAPEQVNEDVF